MKMDLYNAVYIVTNIFFTYTIYKFMYIFFEERISKWFIEIFSYICYWGAITLIHQFLYVPMALMISNLFLILLITLNYRATLKVRLLSTLLIYLVLMCIEMIIVLLGGYINFPLMKESQFSSVFGIILIRCISFIMVLILSGFRNIKRGMNIPIAYWISTFLLPFSSIMIIVLLLDQSKLGSVSLFLCISLLLLFNIITFYLYDEIVINLDDKTQALLESQQNQYYKKQIEVMKSSMDAIRIFRHDLKNQLSTMRIMAQNGNMNVLIEHIDTLIGINDLTRKYVDSGNINFDSILNFKIFEAEQAEIKCKLSLNIPEQLNLSSVEVCSILGNLMDNAINATKKLEVEKRQISINIKYDKKRLIIVISNTYDGKLLYKDGHIKSTHKNKSEHGIGLISVKNTVEKHEGIIEIESIEESFKVLIILPI